MTSNVTSAYLRESGKYIPLVLKPELSSPAEWSIGLEWTVDSHTTPFPWLNMPARGSGHHHWVPLVVRVSGQYIGYGLSVYYGVFVYYSKHQHSIFILV